MLLQATVRDLWRARVEATPERPFLADAERSASFAAADAEMLRLAGGLRRLGVGAGDRVLVGLENGIRAVLVQAALRELGAITVPLLPGLPLPELSWQANHCGAATLVAEDPIASLLLPALAELPALESLVVPAAAPPAGRPARRLDLEALDAGPGLEPRLPLPGHDQDSPSTILYTSGSTGRPKGVVLPAGAMASAGRGYSERFGIGPADNLLVATPLAHAVGALTKPGMALVQGCRMTVVDRFSPRRFWADVERFEATATVLFPAQLNLLLQVGDGPAAGATPLRLVVTHAWVERFRERFGVQLALVWGMTETGALGTGTPVGWRPPDGDAGGTVGPPMSSVELSVRDASGADLGRGQEGELWTRNGQRMLAYLDDPEATAATLRDGWLCSGDRAEIDRDGWLFYRGRVKNMIKRSGENISPLEVEAVLDGHAAVEESLVLGVPDALRTEEVVAVVSLRAGASAGPAELAAHTREQLAPWKTPRYFRLDREPLARLPNGKIDRAGVLEGLRLEGCWDLRAGGSGG